MTIISALWPYYLKELRRVLHGGGRAFALTLASAMHAFGHALVALVASALALSVAAGRGTESPDVAARGSVGAWAANLAGDKAFSLAVVGLVVVSAKGLA